MKRLLVFARPLVLMLPLLMIICLSGCGDSADYTDYFAVEPAEIVVSEEANEIFIHYSISNISKKDNLSFAITIGETTENYIVSADEMVSGNITIDVGRLTDYQYTYEIGYAVSKNDKVIWEKTESASCDCRPLFVHPAQITYNGETVDVELIDYQINYFDLSELFGSFDDSSLHVVSLKNEQHDIAKLNTSTDSEGSATANEGKILSVVTYGQSEACDTYHYTDDLEISISDGIKAADVDWADNMVFRGDADTKESSVYGMSVTTFTMYIDIENPSDERIYAYVKDFYVNTKAISREYLVGDTSEYPQRIDAHEADSIYTVTSASVWTSTGVRNVEKFGMDVVILNQNKEEIYNGIVWLDL